MKIQKAKLKIPPKFGAVIKKLPKPYYCNNNFLLFHADCNEILSALNEDIDLIFADPPYFLSNDGITCKSGRMVSVNKGKWDKSMGEAQNHAFNLNWLENCRNSLKPDGTIWVSGTSHVIHSVAFGMQTQGFKILNDIIWFKNNAPPNLSCRYFTHSTETIMWAAKTLKSKHYFNYQTMKKLNNGKQMRNLWEIRAPLKAEKKFGNHPTQKPLKLLLRILLASSKEEDIVIDPFSGSATTGIAAVLLNRHYIGIDTEKNFLDLSIKRYEEVVENMELFEFEELTAGGGKLTEQIQNIG